MGTKRRYVYITSEEYLGIVEEMTKRILDIQTIKRNVETCVSRYRKRIPLEDSKEEVFVNLKTEFCTGDLLQILNRLRSPKDRAIK